MQIKGSSRLITILLIVFLAMPAIYSQQHTAADAAKKNEQVKRENKKAYQKARKMTLKHRREIQTKDTRKRMDESNKKALAYNRQNDKKWWEKIFKKHPRR